MQAVCAAAVELQAALETEPLKAGYSMHVETLAIATKSAVNLASQVMPELVDKLELLRAR